jgi:hypothetical protein
MKSTIDVFNMQEAMMVGRGDIFSFLSKTTE